jgi:hypothetical protein
MRPEPGRASMAEQVTQLDQLRRAAREYDAAMRQQQGAAKESPAVRTNG